VLPGCLPLAFKEWLEEIFDSDDENDQEKDLLKEVGLKEKDLKERDLKEKDLKEKNLKQKDLKQKDLEGKKDQLSDEDN
jgi:sensitive to high expression protein 9